MRYKTVPRNYRVNVDKAEINRLTNYYHLTVDFMNDNLVKIYSKLNTWYCEIYSNKLILRHQNRTKKEHFQNEYRDFPFMLKSIYDHDEYKLNNCGDFANNRMSQLFQQIKNNQQPRTWKIS